MAPEVSVATVLVVDDQRTVRAGVCRLLAATRPRPVVLPASNHREAIDAFKRYAPDIVVLDVDLGGSDGLTLLPLLTTRSRVLVLTSHADAATRKRAAELGAAAFVDKGESSAVLLRHFARLLPAVAADPYSRGEQSPA